MSSCDIIIPVWNRQEDLKACVDSIEKNTQYPYRLLIVDNASDSETAGYINDLKKDRGENLQLIRNEENLGFIKAVNKGIAASLAEYVCLLNNDTIVTPGWLGEMVALMEKRPDIGIVNPSSNGLGQNLPKGVTPNEYTLRSKSQSGQFVELGSAFGFCMLMRRKLFGEIGLFDEVYGMGNFEDTDFSLRAKEKGYKSVRALASYVYHKESSSFKLRRSFNKDFERNKKIFESKWGATKRVVIVLKDADKQFQRLEGMLREFAKDRSWIHVISPVFRTEKLFKKYSNLSISHFKNFFYVKAFFKVAFKKKKPDIVYCDDKTFLNVLKVFNDADKKLINEVT
ncbi:MAG: glycosyltransferase family 2 protein [Candidatus Omnitrophica bacterium]|nr:glycosyltransferase family 2 protein [Candidatus Omnitrophota bacterium]